MKTSLIELLAPAKDLEVGKAAINHGADAVYIGGPAFGAREKASNSMADIERLCRHAALFDARVYVTLNTMLRDEELEEARRIAWQCWDAGVDALLVQDLRLLGLDLPPMALHASTQCDNLTVERVQELERMGFSQVVLGRELSIDEIREIRRQTTIPLEFFVHGSLCVSHSGRCYLSEYIGNRSANRGACAQPCRLPWDLVAPPAPPRGGEGDYSSFNSGFLPPSGGTGGGHVLISGRHLLCLKDLNNSAHLEELLDAGITSFKIEGRLKEADYVKNITAFYRQKLDAIFERRQEFVQASLGHCSYTFEVNPEKSFNRGFTDFFIHGRQPGIDSPFTPKSMGEYIGEVTWCNSLRMEIATDKVLHNGDGLCFLDDNDELVGIRADVVNGHTVSCNRPHGAHRGARIYRNYDIEWQKQVDASTGNRKIDLDLVLSETETGYALSGQLAADSFSRPNSQQPIANSQLPTQKIVATNPEKAMENIRKKLSQWGDTIYNPINIEINLSQPYLIPAAVLGEMKRQWVSIMTDQSIEAHRNCRSTSHLSPPAAHPSTPAAHTTPLMTCHHCIRYANGLCPKITGKPTGPLYIRNGTNLFKLEFDCKNCLMMVTSIP